MWSVKSTNYNLFIQFFHKQDVLKGRVNGEPQVPLNEPILEYE